MGFLQSFKDDFNNFWNWMPTEIKIYEDKKAGIEMVEIHNPPNPYVRQLIKWGNDKTKEISMFHLQKKISMENKDVINV